MTTLPAHTSRAIHNKGMQAVYGIAAEYDVDVTDVIALLGTTSHTSISSAHSPFTRLESTTPSQPEAPSKPHAPAADTPATQAAGDTTDGEEEQASSLPPFLSVDPIPEQTAERAPDHGSKTALKETASDEGESNSRPPARRQASTDSRDGALANGLGTTQRDDGASPALPSATSGARKETGRAKILATHAEHPDWPSKLIAEHLGISEDAVRATASRKKIKLVSWWDYERTLKVKTRQELAAAVEKPLEAVVPPAQTQSEAVPELPPVSLPSERLPPPVVRRARAAPTGRFYLRDKTTGHFVHQSLQPNAAGDGPMMTFDRKWAWYDTMERYRGAKKRWPQIEAMRKEASGK